MSHRPIAFVLAAGLAASLALAQPKPPEPTPAKAMQPAPSGTKLPVKTADDLPRHTYHIDGEASEFVLSDAPFKSFVEQVKKDTESDLAKYDITDPTTLQGYYGLLQQIAMLEGRWDDAVAFIDRIRALESKESKKLMTGQVLASLVAARQSAGTQKAAFDAAFKQELASRVGKLPWETVREEVLQGKSRAEIVTRALIVGQLKGQLDPVVAESKGELSGDLARGLVASRTAIDVILPVNPLVADVYGKLIDSHKVAQKDIWTPRLVTLTEADHGTPVVACIWDSGVDVNIFKNEVYTNPNEKMDGKDDDHNGFVDDVHGIAFDLYSNRVPELLAPLDEMKSDKKLVASHTKGLMDLQANVDSPEASSLRKYIRSLKPEQVSPFLEDLNLFGEYSHGTHVAGITAAGNPFVRLLPCRITFDFHQIPVVTPSVEQAEKEAKATLDAVAYMKKAGVRVCNMSWGGSRKDIEDTLEKKHVGKDAAERAALSRTLFKIQRDSLEKAMGEAPNILFVCAAGNSDNDNTFSELLPSGLSLPNMITIGAVDASGKPTGFTTFGKNVSLYANGFEVESYIPGGEKMKFSGTSMASPNVANLAAKLIALDPKLTTKEVIDLIKAGADPMEGYEGRFVIDPKRSIEMLRKHSAK